MRKLSPLTFVVATVALSATVYAYGPVRPVRFRLRRRVPLRLRQLNAAAAAKPVAVASRGCGCAKPGCGCEPSCGCGSGCGCDGRQFAGQTWDCCECGGPPICPCTGPDCCCCCQSPCRCGCGGCGEPGCGCEASCGCEPSCGCGSCSGCGTQRMLPRRHVLWLVLRPIARPGRSTVAARRLQWLQRRSVLERMAQRSAALPRSVRLLRQLDRPAPAAAIGAPYDHPYYAGGHARSAVLRRRQTSAAAVVNGRTPQAPPIAHSGPIRHSQTAANPARRRKAHAPTASNEHDAGRLRAARLTRKPTVGTNTTYQR